MQIELLDEQAEQRWCTDKKFVNTPFLRSPIGLNLLLKKDIM